MFHCIFLVALYFCNVLSLLQRKRLSRDYSGYDEDEEEDDEDADVDEYDDDKQFRTEDDIDKEESR